MSTPVGLTSAASIALHANRSPGELEAQQANPSRLNAMVGAFQQRADAARPHLTAALSTAGAVVAQLAQQAITCGGPTFMREQVSMQLFSALREKHPALAVCLQVGMSAATIWAHTHVREGRMDRATEHNVGVAGHMGVSRDEFAALPADVRARKNADHQGHSRSVTRTQITAETLFAAVAVAGLATGNHDLTARLFATQMRNLVYAASRESGQATLAFTRSSGATHGVNEQNITKMACAYSAMTLAMGMAGDALAHRLLPEGQKISGGGVSGHDGKQLTGLALQKAIALVATVRAICNTSTELIDASLGKHFENSQVGGQQSAQRLNAAALLPRKDYQRLLDHSPTRMAWNNSASAASLIFQQVTGAHGHPAAGVTSFLNNTVSAAAFGLMYPMINQTYQAHAKIRAEVANPTAPVAVEMDDLASSRRSSGSDGADRVAVSNLDGASSARTRTPASTRASTPQPDEQQLNRRGGQSAPSAASTDDDMIEIVTPGAARLLAEQAAAAANKASSVSEPARASLDSLASTSSRQSIDPANVKLPEPGPDEIPLPDSPRSSIGSLAENGPTGRS